MTNARFAKLFGGPRREPESPISQREMDIAASIQAVTEEAMLKAANEVHRRTGSSNLCLAGGVALNCVGNGRILREGPFENVWIQPAAGDAGGALGVALFIWHQLQDKPRTPVLHDSQTGSLLGPQYTPAAIEEALQSVGAVYQQVTNDDKLCRTVAGHMANEKVIGWMQGRMEFGPRALGGRSILGDPRSPKMQSVMNLKIKFRESFRPFAPSVLAERVGDYFSLRSDQQSPYMLLVAPVHPEKCNDVAERMKKVAGIDKLYIERSEIPAVTHVDFSARVQTVDAVRFPRYHKLISAFEEISGCPVVINTSFNVRGEPIVCTPDDAYRCFMATNMDVLIIEDFILLKDDQPNAQQHEIDEYLATFQLD